MPFAHLMNQIWISPDCLMRRWWISWGFFYPPKEGFFLKQHTGIVTAVLQSRHGLAALVLWRLWCTSRLLFLPEIRLVLCQHREHVETICSFTLVFAPRWAKWMQDSDFLSCSHSATACWWAQNSYVFLQCVGSDSKVQRFSLEGVRFWMVFQNARFSMFWSWHADMELIAHLPHCRSGLESFPSMVLACRKRDACLFWCM